MDHEQTPEPNSKDRAASEPVRSRWTPKPEQILILESIFNSGTVNPAKEETVRIRKILEKYGSVGDANVFYWFQNRRSRSRRRQRQMQAAATAGAHHHAGGSAIPYEPNSSSSSTTSAASNSSGGGFLYSSSSLTSSSSLYGFIGDDSCADDLFSICRQMGFMESGQNLLLNSSDVSQLHNQSGTITVFINGIPSDVPRGAFDMRAMFGQDAVLVHSSGELLPANEYGILLQSLQMGESYFLVSRST